MYNYIISSIMLINAVLAGYYAVHTWLEQNRSLQIKALTFCIAFSSCVWSIGFGLLFLMRSPDAARICRSVGLLGVILYMFGVEIMVGHYSSVKKPIKNTIYVFSMLGYVLYPFLISDQGGTYYMTEHGMTYTIPGNLTNNLYTIFCVTVSLAIFYYIHNIIKTSTVRRNVIFGRWMQIVGILIVIGMIADTILPVLTGINAFPGSSITQFYGVVLLFSVLNYQEKSKLTVQNMSNFIYSSISVPVIIYDDHLNPVIINDAVYKFLGQDRLCTGFSELTLEALFDIKGKDVIANSQNNSHQDFETVCRPNNIACHAIIDVITDKYKDIIGYILNIEDISEHINALKEVEEAKRLAESSNHSKSVFLANVSHEIRTPMNSIVGFTELLLNSDLSAEEKGYVDDIRNASKSLLGIINDVLDISKIESGNMELVCDSFNTADLIRDVYRVVYPNIAEKDVYLQTEIDETLPSILYGDSKRLKEIVTNLAGNAIRNTEYGSVTIRIMHKKTDNSTINLHIEVQDTGSGIRPEDIDTLFDTFSQVDGYVHQGVEGSGLELALTHSFITLMDGRIYVESKLKHGSTFIVDIPLKMVDDTPIETIVWDDGKQLTTTLGSTSFESKKVLIVDDSRINIKVFSHILKTYGIEADCVYSGAASIKMAGLNEYDYIFMDQMMPEMDGVEAMKHIRELQGIYNKGERCKIVAFTANAVDGVASKLLKEGFDYYMSKPIDLQVLEEILSTQ